MNDLKTKLKFRLYGQKGLTNKEFTKLVKMGIIKKREQDEN
jgi:hypothetical protein